MRPSQHSAAQVTSYLTANGAGDLAADETARAVHRHDHLDVLVEGDRRLSRRSSTGAIVAFGDSITDGTCSTVDAPRSMGRRAGGAPGASMPPSRGSADAHKAVVNEGIGGNTITREQSPAAARQPSRPRAARARRADPPWRDARHPVHGHQRHPPGGTGRRRSSPARRTSSGA